MPPAPRPHVPRLLLWVGVAAAAWGVVAWSTGGVTFTIDGVRISSRGADRPLVAGAVLVVLALWALPRADRRALLLAVAARTEGAAPWLAGALAVGLTAVSAIFGIHAASGADSAGYLSESRVLARGRLTMDAPPITAQPWPDRGWMAAPFGFAPAPEPDVLAPTYAPGLPMLMAAAGAVAGEAGRFVWTPLCAGLLAAAAFWYTRRGAPATVALAATLLVASSPPLLFAAMQTMSDIPVAALWMAVVLRVTPGVVSGLFTGLVGAVALLVRPNLAFVALALWAASVIGSNAPRPLRLRIALAHAVPLALAAGAIALINTRLWGSPAASGYGAAAILFSTDTVVDNLAAVWRWTRETGGYAIAAGAVAVLGLAVQHRAWRLGAALVVAVLASYLPYFVFREWWYLRFYLPLWPVAAAGAATAPWLVLRTRLPNGAPLLVLLAAGGFAATGVATAFHARVFDLWRGEQRYPAVAAYVAQHASPRAVLVSVQHSGALAYYTGRAIGRFDHIDAGVLDAQVEAWRADGRDVWLVLEDWEVPEFQTRFAGQVRGALAWAPDAEARIGPTRVRVYDLDTPTRQVAPALIPVASRGVWPWRRLWTPAAPQ